jgi:hypothetical protein
MHEYTNVVAREAARILLRLRVLTPRSVNGILPFTASIGKAIEN